MPAAAKNEDVWIALEVRQICRWGGETQLGAVQLTLRNPEVLVLPKPQYQ